MFAAFDPWILSFSAIMVLATIWMGYWAAQKARTASDFFVAGRGVSVGWNASAISGEYLSAASFMGIAGMVMSSGYDALWYPVCYACGYLFLLLFIAGPLRRFGAYTIPDFAEGRYDSPIFRKIAVIFVLFIGFFYTMPQMKGAGTTLSYIFQDITWFGQKGLPYWVGVVLVGLVITFNVAVGGMKGVTLVQAFQYWLKMFAISVPIFVLMSVYGGYGRQLQEQNAIPPKSGAMKAWAPPAPQANERPPSLVQDLGNPPQIGLNYAAPTPVPAISPELRLNPIQLGQDQTEEFWTEIRFIHRNNGDFFKWIQRIYNSAHSRWDSFVPPTSGIALDNLAGIYPTYLFPPKTTFTVYLSPGLILGSLIRPATNSPMAATKGPEAIRDLLAANGYTLVHIAGDAAKIFRTSDAARFASVNPVQLKNGPAYPESELHKHLVLPLYPTLRQPLPAKAPADAAWLNPFGPLTTKAAKAAKLEGEQVKPYALLYTYSLIIALVCGTAGLPHILLRFYTNPDGVAAKRTTMWVMILIGVFYVFPPVFGVMGRNLVPSLYEGTGAKGTDKVVLELPKVLDTSAPGAAAGMTGTTPRSTAAERGSLPWGSILSGITCAGAFAAFMSTFSGLLVSMTGALAHDVYGRMLRPQSSAADRMRMFKWCAALIGGVSTILGCFVEPLEINFMVGQAFAIAAASYFPLLFMSVWWRGMTIRGAATGMLVGGVCALLAVALTNASNLALDKGPMGQLFSAFAPLNAFWAAHPLLRILCEQPAIWTVPLAILLMIVVSRLTAATAPSDIRLKMLVLHAPEKLGLKQDYIREHEGAGH